MKIKKIHWMGLILAVIVLVPTIILLREEKVFYFVVGIAVILGALPFVTSLIMETEREREKEEMFLEFSRNLAESVKSGTPISKSIINLRNKSYSSLTPHVVKLSNQIELGIPVKKAFSTFSEDIGSKVVTRAITLITEAEKSGGNIEVILDSVAKSVAMVDKLRKERKVAVYNLVVQGYVIFLLFLVTIIIVQFKILPITTEMPATESDLGGIISSEKVNPEELADSFLYLLLAQGFFTGLVIGKLSEGSLKPGIKHSFILMALSLLVSSIMRLFFS